MFVLISSAFEAGATIPTRHTCDGEDRSPPLSWTDVPSGTRSLALLVDDPDAPDPAAPRRVWVHWIRYNLAPDVGHLAEGAGNRPPEGEARDALSDARSMGYHGPAVFFAPDRSRLESRGVSRCPVMTGGRRREEWRAGI